jgi:hypothetical protein
MKAEVITEQGHFTAEGECVKPAVITLVCSDISSVGEYRTIMQTLAKEFPVNDQSTALRRNRTVFIRMQDDIHGGKNPREGNTSMA